MGYVPNTLSPRVQARVMNPRLWPVLLRNAAVHCKTLPMRPVDFVSADLGKLGRTVKLIVEEAKGHVERVGKVRRERERERERERRDARYAP